ncbi:MAG: hypothetical protein EO766_13500 [Hydrotalea sp. AMD]|uniref:hypothetical protein n=1 Tax=Hydrotalea sp. AMD TaxID=2501297 RepID=UPI00102743C3|nr:hypothetical protein [Hydrotalea sp. AMD]RWZ86707.1 MAG: hypothetical protein EO766_13500 [Hydrotalea sp. AMD]
MSKTLRNVLNLKGQNLIEVVLTSDSTSTAEEKFNAVKESIVKMIEPQLKTYLTGLNLSEKLKEVDDLEILEKTTIEYIPEPFCQALADHIDAQEGFVLHQKVWLYTTFLDMFSVGARKFCNSFFVHRAQELVNKRRIITY